MEKVSIILPVYNTMAYLPRLFTTLSEQTYPNLEFIFVNDGSPDESGALIDAYVLEEPRAKHIITTNQGLSMARNNGLNHATGTYISFVDSDDYLPLDAIELLVTEMERKQADFVVGSYERIYENVQETTLQKKHPFLRLDASLSGVQALAAPELIRTIYHAAWGKLYKRAFFTEHEELRFKPGIWYEDMEFFLRVFPYLGKIVILEDKVYNYMVREGSIMNTANEKIFDMFLVMDSVQAALTKSGNLEQLYPEIEFQAIYHVLIGTSYRILTSKGMPKIKGLRRVWKYMKQNYPKYNKNKYLQQESIVYRLFVFIAYRCV